MNDTYSYITHIRVLPTIENGTGVAWVHIIIFVHGPSRNVERHTSQTGSIRVMISTLSIKFYACLHTARSQHSYSWKYVYYVIPVHVYRPTCTHTYAYVEEVALCLYTIAWTISTMKMDWWPDYSTCNIVNHQPLYVSVTGSIAGSTGKLNHLFKWKLRRDSYLK